MHGVAFLQDLAVVMLVAGVVTILFHGWKQPVVLGYILAGFVIGPHLLTRPLISVLGLCFGLSLVASKLGFSVALEPQKSHFSEDGISRRAIRTP